MGTTLTTPAAGGGPGRHGRRLIRIPARLAQATGLSGPEPAQLRDTFARLSHTLHCLDRRRWETVKIVYTTEALATGEGRSGHTRTSDGRLDLDLAVPTEMGGSGDGTNPEQLFAAGYAACFHSALQLAARRAKADVTHSAVGARVTLGPTGGGGFGLAVTLEVTLPGLPRAEAFALAEKAHQVCPYSNATRGNIEVTLTVTEEDD